MWTDATIWLALVTYVTSEMADAGFWPRESPTRYRWARLLMTVSLLFYTLHVLSAFAFHHDWSHAAAYDYTAQVTAASTGIRSGGGIFVNYGFSALWLSETIWWWASPDTYRSRSLFAHRLVRGIFLFMIVNGAVVFVDGPMRWVGVGTVGILIWAWAGSRSRSSVETG